MISFSVFLIPRKWWWTFAGRTPLHPVRMDIEIVQNYKYLGVHLDNKLDWTLNTDALYRRGQCQLFFFRRLRYFDVCSEMLQTFNQSVVASVLKL